MIKTKIYTPVCALVIGFLVNISWTGLVTSIAQAQSLPSCNPDDYQYQLTDASKDFSVPSGDIVIATPLQVAEPGGMTISTPGRLVIIGKVTIASNSSLTLTAGSVDRIDCYPNHPIACVGGPPNTGNGASIVGGRLILNVRSGGVGLNSCPFKQFITQNVQFIYVQPDAPSDTTCLFVGGHTKGVPRTEVEITVPSGGLFGLGEPAYIRSLGLDNSHAWIGAGYQQCGAPN